MVGRIKLHTSLIKKIVTHIKTFLLFCMGGIFLLAAIIILLASFIQLPDFSQFHGRKIVESTKIYDRTGKILLYDIHENIKRTVITFDTISPLLKNATIAIEDATFYQHPGINIKSIIRSMRANILGGGWRQGGSTITQQVIKRTLLTSEKLITRKLKEIILSFKLENAFSKDEILGFYLNEAPYGGNIYGVYEASNAFFGKNPSDLSLVESAYLAALPNAPTYLSPYGKHKQKLEDRKNFVLKRMYILGFITNQEYEDARIKKITFLPKELHGIKAPHFVIMVKEYLTEKYGERAIQENGYTVKTTLNYDLQKRAEEVVNIFSPQVEKKFNVKNMALVAIDPQNGQLLSLIGSRNYLDVKNEGNFNVATAQRQPGSAFKPFVYSTAFMKGYTPETILFDLPTNFSTHCNSFGVSIITEIKSDKCYTPEDYDGKYRGPVSLRNSLAQSLNIPSVKLLYLAGINDSITTAQKMGITTLTEPDRYGLSLVLGGAEVSLLEITGAYGVFANDGVYNPTQFILSVQNKAGEIIEEFKESSTEVLSGQVARQITSILSDEEARAPQFGSQSALYFKDRDVAVKTGTTNDYRDVWAIGYTPNITVGMWIGNNDNTPISKNPAGRIVAPVWHAFMEEAFKLTKNERFVAPETEDVSSLPAALRGVWQSGEKDGLIIPEVHSILYWINKDNPRALLNQNPQDDAQFNLWEEPLRRWVTEKNIKEGVVPQLPNTNYSLPTFLVSGIDFIKTYPTNELLTITATSTEKFVLNRADFYINGQLIEKKTQQPFSFSFTPKNISFISKNNDLTIIGYDSNSNSNVYTGKLIVIE